jgi:hypothetical protein
VGETAESLLEMVEKDKAGMSDLMRANPAMGLRCSNGLQKMVTTFTPDRDPTEKVNVYIIWGNTGLGKSHCIFRNFCPNHELLYNKLHPTNQQATDWWDGYDKQSVVLFDDFNPVQYALRHLLQYLHEWPVRVQVKGGSAKALWTSVYFTTNVPPNLWYLQEKADPLHSGNYEALWRRIPKEHICRFVERPPDDVDILKFADLKKFQDARCEALGLNPLGDTLETEMVRARAEKYAKALSRPALERIVVDTAIQKWVEAEKKE